MRLDQPHQFCLRRDTEVLLEAGEIVGDRLVCDCSGPMSTLRSSAKRQANSRTPRRVHFAPIDRSKKKRCNNGFARLPNRPARARPPPRLACQSKTAQNAETSANTEIGCSTFRRPLQGFSFGHFRLLVASTLEFRATEVPGALDSRPEILTYPQKTLGLPTPRPDRGEWHEVKRQCSKLEFTL